MRYIHLGLGTALSFFAFSPLQATCPTLDLKTLPTAACATESSPYRTGSLAKVTYSAKTPCPAQIGLRKWAQGLVSKKTYEGTMVGNVTPGAFTCTYTLDNQWRKALNTQDKELHFDGALPTAKHVTYLNAPLVGFTCPSLDSTMIDMIKNRESVKYPSIKETSFIYTLQPRAISTDSHVTHLVGKIFGSNHSSLPKLASAKAKITKDFEMTCRYEHKTGGEKQDLILIGSSKGNH
jgi:hypothetical protein